MEFKYNIIRAFENERAEGKAEGKVEGKTLKLISLVRKKIRKHNSVEEIAEILEEETASIEPIYVLIQAHPDWDDEKIGGELGELERKDGPADHQQAGGCADRE